MAPKTVSYMFGKKKTHTHTKGTCTLLARLASQKDKKRIVHTCNQLNPTQPNPSQQTDVSYYAIAWQHERIMTVVLQQLPHERVVVRKRAATCLGSVAVVVSEALLNRLAVHLLQKISESPPPDVVRTLIQVLLYSPAAAAAAAIDCIDCVARVALRAYGVDGRELKRGLLMLRIC